MDRVAIEAADVEAEKVAVRSYSEGDVGKLSVGEFAERVAAEIGAG